jgi:c(7)-type cytochrome triheme protein
LVIITAGCLLYLSIAKAEYGDVRINNYSEQHGMRPAVFPHWFHRIRFRCSVCHEQLGFKMKKEANKIDMNKIASGQFCGACHNGKIAWAPVYCDRCHTGAPTKPSKKHVKNIK